MAGRVHGFVSKCSLRGYRNLRRCAPCAKRGDQAEGSSSMEFQDKVLKCIDCGADFVFTAGEQLFFHDKAFRNEPKRCKACKAKRVAVLGAVPAAITEAVSARSKPAPRALSAEKRPRCHSGRRRADRSSAASASSNGGRQLRPDSIFAIKGRASSPSNFRNSQDGRFSSLSSRLPD